MKLFTFLILVLFLSGLVGCGNKPIQPRQSENNDKYINVLSQGVRGDQIKAVCTQDMTIGGSAVTYSQQGKPREALQIKIDSLPVEATRQRRIMSSALEDAYSFEGLDKKAYAFYRFESCYQESLSKFVPVHLNEEIFNDLQLCTNFQAPEFGLCVISVVEKYVKPLKHGGESIARASSLQCGYINKLGMAVPMMRDDGVSREIVLGSFPDEVTNVNREFAIQLINDAFKYRDLDSFTFSLIYEDRCIRAKKGLKNHFDFDKYNPYLMKCESLNYEPSIQGACIRKVIQDNYKG